MPSVAENHMCVKCDEKLNKQVNFNISIYRHLQKCLYKWLCPKLSTNKIRKVESIILN